MTEILSEMRLYSPDGERLYLTKQERELFLEQAKKIEREKRIFCEVIHYTGCRVQEATNLSYSNFMLDTSEIIVRSLKKRKTDNQGRIKQPHFRAIPIPSEIMDRVNLVFDIAKIQQSKDKKQTANKPIFDIDKATGYRWIKTVMGMAGIKGKQACPKGLRHGFGVAMTQAGMPIHILQKLMGHTDAKVTAIYADLMGDELRLSVADAWSKI